MHTKKRGRPRIKPIIKRLIYAKALKEREAPRQALAVELKQLIEEMKEIPPSEETMIKLISRARTNPESPLDEVWTLGSLSEHPIPTDALPIVMSLQYRRLMEYDTEKFLTIREALWAARLYKLIELNKPKHIPPDVKDMVRLGHLKDEDPQPISELASKITVEDLVDDWAWVFANDDHASEIAGEPFNSSEYDAHIQADIYKYWGARRGGKIHNIAVDYGLDRADYYRLLLLNLPISGIEELIKDWKEQNNKPLKELEELGWRWRYRPERFSRIKKRTQRKVNHER